MLIPDILRQLVNESDTVIDGTLIEGIGREIAVDIFRAQIGNHLGRRDHADLNVLIRVDAVLGHIEPQQKIVHRIFERHTEFEAFPVLRVLFVLVLIRENDGLPVRIHIRDHAPVLRSRTKAHGHGSRHWREKMRGVIFAVHAFVARHGPAGSLDNIHLETVLLIEFQGVTGNDRRGAGNWYKADFKFFLLQVLHGIGRHRLERLEGNELTDQTRRCRGTNAFQELAPVHIRLEDVVHDRALKSTIHLRGRLVRIE